MKKIIIIIAIVFVVWEVTFGGHITTMVNRSKINQYRKDYHLTKHELLNKDIGKMDYLNGKGIDVYTYRDPLASVVYKISIYEDKIFGDVIESTYDENLAGAIICDYLRSIPPLYNMEHNFVLTSQVKQQMDFQKKAMPNSISEFKDAEGLSVEVYLFIPATGKDRISNNKMIYEVYKQMAKVTPYFILYVQELEPSLLAEYSQDIIEQKDFSNLYNEAGVYRNMLNTFYVEEEILSFEAFMQQVDK